MPNKLLNARLDAVQTVDDAVALWTYIKSIWTTTTGYAPPAVSLVKFDTKFGDMKGFLNYFIVENMPNSIKPQTIGGSRYRYEEAKRVQIMCIGPSAKNNKWLMEKHIDSLVNGNLTGMQTTYGIDFMQLSEFNEIPGETEANISGLEPTKKYQVSRSSALVTLFHEAYSTVA